MITQDIPGETSDPQNESGYPHARVASFWGIALLSLAFFWDQLTFGLGILFALIWAALLFAAVLFAIFGAVFAFADEGSWPRRFTRASAMPLALTASKPFPVQSAPLGVSSQPMCTSTDTAQNMTKRRARWPFFHTATGYWEQARSSCAIRLAGLTENLCRLS